MRTPTELTAAFRAQGLKVTPQRQLLFRLLHGNDAHPTADALYAQASNEMPGISLRTVYQTLTDLVAMGELRSLHVTSGAVRFDPNVADHHHVVCTECGTVRDVYLEGTAALRAALQPQFPGPDLDGFDIDDINVQFTGRCAPCARAATTESNPQP